MKEWIELDNAAKIYPPAATKKWTAMFRLSVTLTEDVDPDLLRAALGKALVRFPSFSCRLRRGFFWYYLEHIDGAPPVLEDVFNPLSKLDTKKNGHFMFRVLYYKSRIACEFSHALTDGHGGMTFLTSLVAEYVKLKQSENIEPSGYVLSLDDVPSHEEYEDSFLKYASRETKSRSESPSYNMSGQPVPFGRMLFVSAKAPTEALMPPRRRRG